MHSRCTVVADPYTPCWSNVAVAHRALPIALDAQATRRDARLSAAQDELRSTMSVVRSRRVEGRCSRLGGGGTLTIDHAVSLGLVGDSAQGLEVVAQLCVVVVVRERGHDLKCKSVHSLTCTSDPAPQLTSLAETSMTTPARTSIGRELSNASLVVHQHST